MEKANQKGLNLYVNYVNISESNYPTENYQNINSSRLKEMYSPIMKSDVSRIQQVLLNL